ncbi:MAG: thioredoxin family protein [Rhizomicrobium sp.]
MSHPSASHPIVSQEEWLTARKALLAKEKEEGRLRDEVNAARMAMPWVKVEKDYVFDTPSGKKSLAELFDGRDQLVVYHFMLGPDWTEGCLRCSFLCDHIGDSLPHLNNHGVTWTAVSRAPLAGIETYKSRMGWKFPWASSFGSDFNHDFNVSFTEEERASGAIHYNYADRKMNRDELSGLSSFVRGEQGEVFHAYSTYARGLEALAGTLLMLDRTALGRRETSSLSFVKRRDEYREERLA